MLSDYGILGVEEGADENAVKAAYRQRVKAVHPDHSSDEDAFKNHLLFIQINQAYRRVLRGLAARSAPSRVPRPAPPRPASAPAPSPRGTGPGLVQHRDPAYVYYRTATRFFEQIHPAKWSMPNARQSNRPRSPFDAREQTEMKRIVQDLARLFPKAYYYYSLVVDDYPDSVWSADAADKMRLIEERTRLYERILESFGVWDKEGPHRTFKPVGTA